MSEDRKFRVGLVGAGYVSEFHIEALRRLPQVTIVGIADLDIARARLTADRLQLPLACSSLAELLAAGVDAVHVLTPPAAHARVALEALGHGCHVLIEKPLATNVEDCDRLRDASLQAGKAVGVVHSYLRDPFISHALDLVRNGAIGDVVGFDYFRSSIYPPYLGGPLPPQYRDGGYPFRDLGVHALYLMEAFLGEIQDVTAEFRTRGGDPNLLFDEWRALVQCRRATGQIQISWNVKPLQHVLYLQGTKGLIRADVFSMFVSRRKKTRLPGPIERALGPLGEAVQMSTQVPMNATRFLTGGIRRYHGLQTLIAEFYQSLAENRPPPFGVADARSIVAWTEKVARVADAAKERHLDKFRAPLTAPTLLTGATGFIGGHLLRRLLARGERVRILARREPAPAVTNNPQIEVVLGDLGDPEVVARAVAGSRVVYHLGAGMRGDAAEFERGTVAGTRNLIESALRHNVERLIYVSSVSVLHMTAIREGIPIREDFPLEAAPGRRGHYTQTKLEAERLVVAAARDRGLPVVILRPGQVFGPGSPLVTGAVGYRFGKGLLILGNGEVRLPLVYVDDVVDALLMAAAAKTAAGAVFHLVDPSRWTQLDLARRALGQGGAAPRIARLPLPVVLALAGTCDIVFRAMKRSAPLSIYRVKSSLASMTFDCSAAETQLGWKPRVGVEEGLRLTLESASG